MILPVQQFWGLPGLQLRSPLRAELGPSLSRWSFHNTEHPLAGMAVFQKYKPQDTSTSSIFVWITFVDVLLVKASHVAKLSITGEGNDSLGAICFTIYKMDIPFTHHIFTRQLLCARHFARGLGTMVKTTDMAPALIYTLLEGREAGKQCQICWEFLISSGYYGNF